MKLQYLRQHYAKRNGNTWVPKMAFKTPEEVKEKLGFDLEMCDIYPCDVCNLLHISKIRK